MKWNLIADDCLPPKDGTVMLANDRDVMGQYSGRTVDSHGVTWFIDDCCYDGDAEPMYWLLLPPIPG